VGFEQEQNNHGHHVNINSNAVLRLVCAGLKGARRRVPRRVA